MGVGEGATELGLDNELLFLLRPSPLSRLVSVLPRRMSLSVGALDAAVPVAMRKPGGRVDSRNLIEALRRRLLVLLSRCSSEDEGEAVDWWIERQASPLGAFQSRWRARGLMPQSLREAGNLSLYLE